jgi:F420H(2)-dependent quinone reductase
VGSDTYQADATVVEGPERDRLYAEQARRFPPFSEYQAKTTRTIPVIVLNRKR